MSAEIPDELYEDLLAQRLVIFAGAGTSTESSKLSPEPTFYEKIKTKCKYPVKKGAASFPDVMQYFCDKVDGGQRNRLTSAAIARIEEFAAPGESNRIVTMFSDGIATIPFVDRVVTTNWDPFLEQSMGILVSMVEDRDLAFWNDSKRQVLKIHGCVRRPYTLVATKDDYKACLARNPLLFNKLRDLMSSRTFVFVGYGLRDSDFRIVWEEIVGALGALRKLAYAISPDAEQAKDPFFARNGIRHINLSDVAFVRALYARLVKDGHIASPKLLKHYERERERILKVHFDMAGGKSNGAFASAMYQDGLLHSLSDILSCVHLGKLKRHLEDELRESLKWLKQMKNAENIVEIAYWSGRCEALRTYCWDETSKMPIYFHPYRLQPTQKFIKG